MRNTAHVLPPYQDIVKKTLSPKLHLLIENPNFKELNLCNPDQIIHISRQATSLLRAFQYLKAQVRPVTIIYIII